MKRYPLIIGISFIVACAIAVYALFGLPRPNAGMYTTISVNQVNLQQVVHADGMVVAGAEIDLGFQQSGQIRAIHVAVGDSVKKGDVLAELDGGTSNVQFQAAQAALAEARANLADNATNVQINYASAQKSAAAAVADAYTKVASAIQNDSDTFFSNPQSLGNPKLLISTQTQQQEQQIETEDIAVHKILQAWKAEIGAATSTSADVLLADSRNYIAMVTAFMNNLSVAITAVAQSTSSASQVAVTSQLATANAGIALVAAATSEITTADNALVVATPQSAAALQAKITQAQAAVAAIQNQIAQNAIIAPVDGVITAQNGNIGQVISAALPTTIIHLISTTPYQINTYVSEADVASLAVGQTAEVVLEAYGTDVSFPATLVSVDQGQTIVRGVGMYKITLQFTNADARIKDGMSATASIVVGEKDGVITVPESAILNENSSSSVLTVASGKITQTPITVGVSGVVAGSAGMWSEVASGLSTGQNVVTFTNQ